MNKKVHLFAAMLTLTLSSFTKTAPQINNNNILEEQLLTAVQNGDVNTVQTLLKLGADPNFQENDPNLSPLYSALVHNHIKIAHMLLNAGANPNAHIKLYMPSFPCWLELPMESVEDTTHHVSTLLDELRHKWPSYNDERINLLLEHGAHWPQSHSNLTSENLRCFVGRTNALNLFFHKLDVHYNVPKVLRRLLGLMGGVQTELMDRILEQAPRSSSPSPSKRQRVE